MQWFRVYHEMIHDRKLRRLPTSQRWLWIALLTLASESPERGKLLLAEGEPVTMEDLADAAAVTMEDVEAGFQAFSRHGMIHRDGDVWTVSNWDERQRESDDAAKRQRDHRARLSRDNSVTGHVTVTPQIQMQKQIQNNTYAPAAETTPSEPVAVSQPLPEVASATPAREKRKPSSKTQSATPAAAADDETTTAPAKDAKPRPRDPIWDALIAAFYEPKTQGERGRFGKVVHDLKAAGATPEQIAERCAWHAHLLADGALRWTLTPTALANNWGEIERLWKSRDTPGGKPARQWVRAGAPPQTSRAAIGPDELPNPFERKKPQPPATAQTA